MKFSFNIRKRHAFALLGMIVLVGIVYAYGTTTPQAMGHSDGEIQLTNLGQSLTAWSNSINTLPAIVNTQGNAIAAINGLLNCPAIGGIQMLDGGDFCIDSQKRGSGLDWDTAVSACANNGLRLCSGIEWVSRCKTVGWSNSWYLEWAGDVVDDFNNFNAGAITYGASNWCDSIRRMDTDSTAFGSDSIGYRCCKNLI